MTSESIHPGLLTQSRQQLVRAYVRCRRFFHPSYKGDSKRWENVYRRAAVWCVEHLVQPEALVRAAFEVCIPYPQPNHLLGTAARDRALSSRHGNGASDELDKLTYLLELDEVRTYARLGLSLSDILLDANVQLGTLHRYSLARQAGLTGIALQLKEAAALEADRRTPTYLRHFPASVLAGLSQ